MPDLHFTAHGNLVNILGTKLIDELSVAVLELVKNSYDADATLAEIKLEKIFDPEDAIVIVHDDGKGMTLDDIQNRWLVAGFSEKEGQVLRRERTPREGSRSDAWASAALPPHALAGASSWSRGRRAILNSGSTSTGTG
ncbi:ATP-binding protein [Tepidiforma flava]|uniref:ATP-binding protein n=1 Tax=Tepidiforma flava TaxID=3004094 RepID=UPI003570BF80